MDYEKLGVFYLGKQYDLDAGKRTDEPILYDSRDLVTHAVCVGMTGSGKTGLCLGLIEEAAIDGIPAIVIDPKGDLANLLLTFPDLKPADFRPWINEDDARRKGVSPDDFAAAQAQLWSKGLADWQQSGERIARLKGAADFAVYTPGSSAGLPISILRSFAAPAPEVIEDRDIFRERIATTATSLLGLIGVDADPIKSREHILLSTIIEQHWRAGEDLDLGKLVQEVQKPAMSRIGVVELEAFFPSQDRFALAMQINSLLASPGFQAWTEGEPLDIGAMLYTPAGKPRVAIFSIAHLSDGERMFFVALLLSQVLGWTRTQSGTTSLRALVYMDEIAGYCPPVANPPSKAPMLLLMKQARAFGVGMVLATQNPVDLDYKGLSNAGTWFLGRLQTERDKARVLDGLEGAMAAAAAKFDRSSIERTLSQLGSRVFLMNNVHDDAPTILETRWTLSYLRGPLARAQIKALMDPRRAGASSAPTPGASTPAAPLPTPAVRPPKGAPTSGRPVLPPDVPQFFIPTRSSRPSGSSLAYAPMILGLGSIYYSDPGQGVDQEADASLLAPIASGPVPVDWTQAAKSDLTDKDLEPQPEGDASFDSLPPEGAKARSYDAFRKDFADSLFRTAKLELWRSAALELVSSSGESERDFRARLAQAAREQRDAATEKLRARYAPKLSTLQERARRAQQAVEVQQAQARQAKLSTALSFGTALLGAFLGRKVTSASNISKMGSAARGVGRSIQESGDVGRAEESVQAVQQQIDALNAQFQGEVDALAGKLDGTIEQLDKISLKPKKTNIKVKAVVLAWLPFYVDGAGNRTDATV